MKLNVDILMSARNKNAAAAVNEEADVGKFTLDPEEQEMFVSENEEERSDIQEAATREDETDTDADNDESIATTDDDMTLNEDNQHDPDQLDDWLESENQNKW